MKILNRYTNEVVFEDESETIKETVENAVKQGASLDGASLTRASLDGASLTRANLTRANLTRASLDGASLDGANLTRANLTRASLTRASLDGASLTWANLTRASLDGASLTRANLTRANLTRASLDGASLDGASLDEEKIITLKGLNPIFQIGPIGSRSDTLIIFHTNKGLYAKAGCFFGTSEEFLAKVQEHHGDNEHGRNYRAAIEFANVIFRKEG